MITEILIDILTAILEIFIRLLPDAEPLPANVSNAFIAITPYWNMLESFFPVSTVLQIISLGLAVETGFLLFKLANFMLNKLRGSG